jgi:hypothetical protein
MRVSREEGSGLTRGTIKEPRGFAERRTKIAKSTEKSPRPDLKFWSARFYWSKMSREPSRICNKKQLQKRGGERDDHRGYWGWTSPEPCWERAPLSPKNAIQNILEL